MKKLVVGAVLLGLFGFAALATLPLTAKESDPHASAAPSAPARFTSEAIDAFSRVPVQDGGRVKPLSTYAGFTLLGLNGKREVKTPSGAKISATEWLMDCLFFPEQAAKYEFFVVDDTRALDAIGLPHEGRDRRSRYSYMDLAPARERLMELAQQYAAIEEKKLEAVQGQVVNLAHNVMRFESIASLVGPVAHPPRTQDSPALTKLFGAQSSPGLADVLERAPEVRPFLAGSSDPHGHGATDDPHGAAAGEGDPALRAWIEDVVTASRALSLIPPPASAKDRPEWLTPGDVAAAALFHGEKLAPQIAVIRDLEAMAAAREDPYTFRTHAESFRDHVVAMAESRGEYGKVPIEVTFYRADFFFKALCAFVLAFLFVAFSWVKPAKFLTRGAIAGVAAGTLLLAAGITMRCVIRDRPPVSTLYETILFITAVSVIVAMVAEYVNRQGIALALSTLLGAGGCFLANRYEMQDKVDTMPSLVAVLDTNFWLATHVTCVTIGYGAGLLAGAVGHVYLFGKLLGFKRGDAGFYKTLTSMTYGMLCFGLLFSVVGTVLGGIWANESWGRFWGWDPKENGALAIVLWELIVLHARMGGYIRDFGVAMASVFGASVVAASWWGVNLLGVGLHSYGFTSGILSVLLWFFAIEGLVLLVGGVWWLAARNVAPPGPPSGAPPLPPSDGAAAL